jgi:hypothetical protein
MSNLEFLKIQIPGKISGTKQRHTFSIDEERGRIVEQIDKIEEGSEHEEYFNTKTHTISDFASSFDMYMGHPGKIWSDEDLAEQIVGEYLFDENFYD